MKMKTKIILAWIVVFAFILILSGKAQASSTVTTVEEDTNGALVLSDESSDEEYILEATEDVYADFVIGSGENVTLNLGNYSFYNSTSGASAITVEDGGTLTIKGSAHLSKITIKSGGILSLGTSSSYYNIYMDEPIYNYGTIACYDTIYNAGEHAIVNYGDLNLATASITLIRDTEKSTGYAIYNYGTIELGVMVDVRSVSNYGFLINEGTVTQSGRRTSNNDR